MKEVKTTNFENITAIFLNGKAVRYPVSFNKDEGWVEMQVPVQLSEGVVHKNGGNITSEEPDVAQFHWQTVRKEGKVEVMYAENASD